jgi:hypothetical protein
MAPHQSAAELSGGSDVGARTGYSKVFVIAVVAVAVVLAGAVAVVTWWPRGGKTAAQQSLATASPSASATATVSAAEADAAAQAISAYTAFEESYAVAAADPGNTNLPLKGAGPPLRLQTSAWLQQMARDGLVVRGTPKHTVKATSVDLSTVPHVVVLEDCYDTNDSKTVDKASGKSQSAPGQLARYVTHAKAELYSDGRWMISSITADRKTPC